VAPSNQSSSKHHESLFQQVSNNLVLHHLQQSKYDYTLSVFVTESLTNPEKVQLSHPFF